jgi:hypothetical protein
MFSWSPSTWSRKCLPAPFSVWRRPDLAGSGAAQRGAAPGGDGVAHGVAPLEKHKEELPLESPVDEPEEELPLVEMAPPTQLVPMEYLMELPEGEQLEEELPMVVASMEYVMELPMKKQPEKALPMGGGTHGI